MNARISMPLCVAAAVTLCACGDSARVVRRALPGGGVAISIQGPIGDPVGGWRLQEDLRLGTADGDSSEIFGFVSALRADDEGRIYVLDAIAQSIRVFDSNGALVRVLGRKGRGPGELLGADAFYLGPDGRVLVPDPRNARYTVLDIDGAPPVTRSRPVEGLAPLGGFLSDGTFVDWGLAFPEERPGVVAGARLQYVPFRVAADLTPIEQLPPIEFERTMISDGTRPQIYFTPRPQLFQDHRGGVWFTSSAGYEVQYRSLAGDSVLVVTLPGTPAVVTAEDREVIRSQYPTQPSVARDYLEALPDRKPVVRGVFGDGAGHVFIVPELADVNAGTALDVLREDGTYLGRLMLPTPMTVGRTRVVAAGTGTHLYYLSESDEGVHQVVRVRLLKGDGPT